MRVAIVLVGDELLAGHTRDANGHYLAKRLNELGHKVRRISTVPDERHAIVEEIDLALTLSDVVLVSGGLGPTHDDRTTEAIAERFGRRLVVDEAAWSSLRSRYDKRGTATPRTVESARKMVMVPEGAEVLENPVGAACGYVVRAGATPIVVLPGVPAELQAIFEKRLVGGIVPRGDAVGLLEVDVHLPEAAFAHALGLVADRFADVEIGSYPHFGEKRVTLRFRGETARAREALAAFYASVPDAEDEGPKDEGRGGRTEGRKD